MEVKCSDCSDLEIALKRAIKEDLESDRVKAPLRLFENIMESLEIKRGRRRLKRIGRGFLIACSIFLFMSTSLYLLFPDKVSEGGRRLVKSVTYIFAGSFNIETADPVCPHADQDEERILREIMRIRNAAPFKISYPVYVPPEFTVSEITVRDEEAGFSLTIMFKRENQSFVLVQREAAETAGPELEDERAKKVKISGNQGLLVRHSDGSHTLSFLDDRGVSFMLKGHIAEDEMLRVAASFY